MEEIEAKKTGLMLFSGIGLGALGRKTESSRSDKLRLGRFGLIWVFGYIWDDFVDSSMICWEILIIIAYFSLNLHRGEDSPLLGLDSFITVTIYY